MIEWLAKRRCNFVDAAACAAVSGLAVQGRYATAVAVLVVGAVLSALLEVIAEQS